MERVLAAEMALGLLVFSCFHGGLSNKSVCLSPQVHGVLPAGSLILAAH